MQNSSISTSCVQRIVLSSATGYETQLQIYYDPYLKIILDSLENTVG